jgi:hypothetical protein
MARTLLLALVVAINLTPDLGEIRAAYFESLNKSQVWINLEPQNLEPGPSPLRLNVTVAFPGRSLRATPPTVDIRAHDDCAVFPTRVRRPGFAMIYDGVEVRAGADGVPVLFASRCGDGPAGGNVSTTRIPFATLQRIGVARNVAIHAFGFRTRLTKSDTHAIASFMRTVAEGVSLK